MRVHDLSISYGSVPVLEGASLAVGEGQFVSLVGPSGSGKSSLLRAVIGLQQPLGGTVDPGVASSEIGILFQDDALLPWRTAHDNVALGLRFQGPPPGLRHQLRAPGRLTWLYPDRTHSPARFLALRLVPNYPERDRSKPNRARQQGPIFLQNQTRQNAPIQLSALYKTAGQLPSKPGSKSKLSFPLLTRCNWAFCI